jgi:hypothetical protein
MLCKLDIIVITCHIALLLFLIVFWSADVRRVPVMQSRVLHASVLHASVLHDYDGFGCPSMFPFVFGFQHVTNRSIEVESGPDADTPRPVGVGLLLCMLERGGEEVAQALVSLTAKLQVMCYFLCYFFVLFFVADAVMNGVCSSSTLGHLPCGAPAAVAAAGRLINLLFCSLQQHDTC